MRNPPPSRTSYFLGVRLTEEERRALDELGDALGVSSRSEAIRALVRKREEPSVPAAPPLPPTLRQQLADLVEDGWVANEGEALALLVTLGLSEFSRIQTDRVAALRGAARATHERRQARRRADRAGRGLLER